MSESHREPIVRLSTMVFDGEFEDLAWDPAMLECGDRDWTPILPLIAHEDLSLPLIREPSPVVFVMEAISPARRIAG